MQATRLWVVVCLAASVSASSPGCGEQERTPGPSCVDCGGESGNNDGAGLGGDASNVSGSSTLTNGGKGGTPSHAGTSTGGGSAGRGGQQSSGQGGEGGAVTNPSSEQLELCGRLAKGSESADTVTRGYVTRVLSDCRLDWLFPHQELSDLANRVLGFSYNFWGCPKTLPVSEFGLVLGTPQLSQGDVNLLIDHYLDAAQKNLDLSPLERETMQAALIRLSKPLIADASLEPSKPNCPVPMGGAGAGGAEAGGSGGAGGAPANAAGGAL